jgi:serine phosphatase RsbU (regulator of sigma subunit)/ligand-binding sensor domain-containing protein
MLRINSMLKSSISIISFIIFCLSLSSYSYGQRNYLFENISIAEGLSNASVQYIFQDSHGFLWISTEDGLNRFDGNNIKVFKNDPNDSTTIPNNVCGAIVEDSDGYIWVGVFGNIIARFDPKSETFKKYSIATGSVTDVSYFFSALFDLKGNLWFGSTNHGMQKLNRLTDKFEQVFLDSTNKSAQWGEVHGIIELKNGNILSSDYADGIKIYNEKLNVFQPYYLKTNYSPTEIDQLYEDISGNIWFGGRDQLIKYSPSYYTTDDYDLFSLIKKPTNYDNVTGITQDDEGYLWVGIYSQGIYRVDINTKDIRAFDYKSKNSDNSLREIIGSIYKDKYGVIWIGTWFQGLIKFDPLREPFKYNKFKTNEGANSNANIVTSIAGSQQGKKITIGTSADGFYSFDLKNYNSINLKINFDQTTIPDGTINIQSLAIDNEDNIWFSYNNLGLHKYNKAGVFSFIKSPNEKKTSTYNINNMKIDLSGNLWFTSENGFEKYNPTKNEFSLLPTIMTKKMSQTLKQQISKIPDSRDPISSISKVGEASNLEKKFSLDRDQKVLILCLGEGRMIQGNDGLFDKGSLLTDDGKLIWSMNDLSKTFNDGGGFKNRIAIKCVELKKGDYKITFTSDVGHSYGNWNVVAPPDSLWWGIQVLNLNDAEYDTINELNEIEINSDKYMPTEFGRSIEISKRLYNVLWLGSTRNSFFKYDLATGNFRQYNYDTKNKFSPNNFISFIFEDREGIIWLATRNSLVRFDPVTEKIERYDQRDGLSSSLVNSIIEDLQGNLWISTSGGLSKLNKNAPRDKWNFVNFDTRDGLLGFGSSKANWISKNGEMFLGSNDGITSFFPGKINGIKPDIVIEDIKISEVSLKSDSAVVKLQKSIMKLDELDLSYTQNNLSFEFASIHFSRPEKNKIFYKLEGFNTHWISTDRNFASFTNLEPGEYIFKVKGSNGDGIWNDDGTALRIIISPPWWRTYWAYFGYVLFFALGIFAFDRIQRARVKLQERRKAEITILEAENERKTKELDEARELQLSMLPKELPQLPHLDIAVYMQTATEVGGDYYDFHVSLDGTLTVVIGDATGHGMKAGTMVTAAKSLFNSYAPNPDILFSFQEITRCIKNLNMGKMSMCLTMLKIKGDKMQISTAGMPPSFIFRRDTRVVEEHLFKAMPLGTMEKFPYEIKDTTLKPGDTILLITDGLPELKNDSEEMYGYKRIRNGFEDVAEKAPEEIVSYLKNEGASWVNNADPDDDVTFVVIKVKS